MPPRPDDKFQSAHTQSSNRTSGEDAVVLPGTKDTLENPAATAAPAAPAASVPATRAMLDPELLDILRNAPRRADARVKSAELLRCLSHEASASNASSASNGTGAKAAKGISCKVALDFTPLC